MYSISNMARIARNAVYENTTYTYIALSIPRVICNKDNPTRCKLI